MNAPIFSEMDDSGMAKIINSFSQVNADILNEYLNQLAIPLHEDLSKGSLGSLYSMTSEFLGERASCEDIEEYMCRYAIPLVSHSILEIFTSQTKMVSPQEDANVIRYIESVVVPYTHMIFYPKQATGKKRIRDKYMDIYGTLAVFNSEVEMSLPIGMNKSFNPAPYMAISGGCEKDVIYNLSATINYAPLTNASISKFISQLENACILKDRRYDKMEAIYKYIDETSWTLNWNSFNFDPSDVVDENVPFEMKIPFMNSHLELLKMAKVICFDYNEETYDYSSPGDGYVHTIEYPYGNSGLRVYSVSECVDELYKGIHSGREWVFNLINSSITKEAEGVVKVLKSLIRNYEYVIGTCSDMMAGCKTSKYMGFTIEGQKYLIRRLLSAVQFSCSTKLSRKNFGDKPYLETPFAFGVVSEIRANSVI
jgi:hypothetical protein